MAKSEDGGDKFLSSKESGPPGLCFQLSSKKSLPEKIDYILHRPMFEYLVIFLIIVDSLLVVASLMLEINLVEVRSSLPNKDHEHTYNVSSRTLERMHNLEHASEALHFTSMSILLFFLFEVFLKLYCQKMQFFKRKVQVADSFIVAISMALDIAVLVINSLDSSILNGLGLIIVLRLWRLIRIVNGAVVATKNELEEKIRYYRDEASAVKLDQQNLQVQLEERKKEIDFLKGRLVKYEPIDMLPSGATKLPPYLPETKKFPSQVLGDVTDDEDHHLFTNVGNVHFKKASPLSVSPGNTAFQVYQPGATYHPTSQFPASQSRLDPSIKYKPNDEALDTADESDVVSIKPSKTRSGNTFTVKKDGVPMTSL